MPSAKPTESDALVAAIHASGQAMALATTGGGSLAISSLLTVPGASRSVVEAVVPYSSAALDDYLGVTPERYCESRTARAMAMAAYERARRLSPVANESAKKSVDLPPFLGVGCTASLVSNLPKRGAHRAHVAAQTANCTT